MNDVAARYAVYFAPPRDNPWWPLLSGWLGYDACTGGICAQPALPGIAAHDFAAVTAHPRRYGAHATLKAPFRLAQGCSETDLLRAADTFAAGHSAFVLPGLEVELLGNFIALVAAAPDQRINSIADACTRDFDRFRAPPSSAETARRLREPLDAEGMALLEQWGYPHVLQRYRFHLSLTGNLDGYAEAAVSAVLQAAHAMFEPLAATPLHFDAICVFRQDGPDQRFALIHRSWFSA